MSDLLDLVVRIPQWKASHGRALLACLAFSGVLLTGCGGGGEGPPEVVPVSGNVEYNGQPVVGATVQFFAEGAPRPARGVTGEDGSFTLTSYEPNDGAVPGTHQVLVTRTGAEEIDEPVAAVTDLEAEGYVAAMKDAEQSKRGNGGLPGRYAELTRTDLTVNITPGEPNVVKLQLKK